MSQTEISSLESIATARSSPGTAEPHDAPRASSGRGRTLAVAAVTAPLALAAAVALHPADTADAGASLARIGGDDRIRWVLVHLLEPAVWITLALVFLGLGAVPATRGRLPLRLGATMAAVGAAAIAMIVYAHGEAYFHMTAEGVDTSTMEGLYTRFQDQMPLAGPLSLAFQIGLVLVGVGLFRSRLAPRWAAILLALTPAAMAASSEAPAPATALGVVPLAVALAATAPALRAGSAAR